MSFRQKDLPIFDLIDLMEKQKFAPETRDTVKKIILAAYDLPAYRSENNQERSIKEFANEMAIACMKQLD